MLTSYLVSNAIILPMTGWLGNYFGRKRVLLSCVVLFTFASALCGLAWNLPTLILARILQGAGGGAMVPIAQAIMLESFPPAKRGAAMAMFAQGVVVAPILGPTLGGWITDNYSWRWIFYINLPVGILAVLMAEWLVEDPPYIKRNKAATIDFIGFGLLARLAGDAANRRWTRDRKRTGSARNGSGGWWQFRPCFLVGFVVWEFTADHPLVDLRVFQEPQFRRRRDFDDVVGAILYGTTAELPLFLQTLMGYPALQSGYAMSPRGIGGVLHHVLRRAAGRAQSGAAGCCASDFTMLAVSSFMLSDINLQVSQARVIWPSVINGIAISFIFVPLTTATMSQLRQPQIGNATGLYNLMRNLGGSIGIAFVTTMLARGAQAHQALMVGHLTPTDPAFSATARRRASPAGAARRSRDAPRARPTA